MLEIHKLDQILIIFLFHLDHTNRTPKEEFYTHIVSYLSLWQLWI